MGRGGPRTNLFGDRNWEEGGTPNQCGVEKGSEKSMSCDSNRYIFKFFFRDDRDNIELMLNSHANASGYGLVV